MIQRFLKVVFVLAALPAFFASCSSGKSSSSGSSSSTSSSSSSSNPAPNPSSGTQIQEGSNYYDTSDGGTLISEGSNYYNTATGGTLIAEGGNYYDTATGGTLIREGNGYYNTATGQFETSFKTIESVADFVESANTQGSLSDAVGGGTKDVDLQASESSARDQADRAQVLANSFNMDYSKALELTRLADQVQSLPKSNQMTTEDQDAITQKALGVGGVSVDEVNAAITQVVKDGNEQAVDDLMTKAAANLGMPSSAGLRDQILPALGIHF